VAGFGCFLLVAAIAGAFVWWFMSSRKALATTVVETRCAPEQAAAVVANAFKGVRSILWTAGTGPGAINMRRRGKERGITMSIDIEPNNAGGSRVSMWASQYNEYLGFFANFSNEVNGRKKAITRMLDETPPSTTSPGR
jgi:hypothetical protein